MKKTIETCAYLLVLSVSGCATKREVRDLLEENAALQSQVEKLSLQVERTTAIAKERDALTNDRIDYTQVQMILDQVVPQTIPIISRLAQAKAMGKEVPADLEWSFQLDNGRIVSMMVEFDGEEFEIKHLTIIEADGTTAAISRQLKTVPERMSGKLNSIFEGFLDNMSRQSPQSLPLQNKA